jgi:hypothetical protein
VLLAPLAGCGEGLVEIDTEATVRFQDLEGGFYGLVTDDGQRYDPINLPREFQEDGLRVHVVARVREDMASVHAWGVLVEISSIRRA